MDVVSVNQIVFDEKKKKFNSVRLLVLRIASPRIKKKKSRVNFYRCIIITPSYLP